MNSCFLTQSSDVAQLAVPDHPEDQANVRFFNSMHAAARIGWRPPTFYDLHLRDQLGRVQGPDAHRVGFPERPC